jgi:hypothetical protein
LSELSVNNHKIHDGDFVVMLDCLDELFRECGDTITPKVLASRMEQKLHRRVHYSFATYLYTLSGFVTKPGIGNNDRFARFIVYNPELIAVQRARLRDISAEVGTNQHGE